MEVLLRRPEPRFGLAVGLVVAVILHLLAVPGASFMPMVASSRPNGGDVGALGARVPSTAQQRVELRLETPKVIPAPAPPEPVDDDHDGQVVNLPAKKEERPDAADYRAEQDQKTARETRARVTGLTPTATRAPSTEATPTKGAPGAQVDRVTRGKNTSTGGPVGDGAAEDGKALTSETTTAGGGAPKLAMELPRLQGRQALRDTASGTLRSQREQAALDGNSDSFRLAMGRLAETAPTTGEGAGSGGVARKGGSGGEGAAGAPNLVPGVQEIARLAGLPRTDRLLVEEDDETSINAFAFRYATYFNRVSDAVRVYWSAEGLQRVDPTGNIYGIEDRTAVLQVTINRAGEVIELVVQEPSGVDAVDDDALQAVRKAQPFPHPPDGLFRGEDRVSFRFGFTIEKGRRNAFWNPPGPPAGG